MYISVRARDNMQVDHLATTQTGSLMVVYYDSTVDDPQVRTVLCLSLYHFMFAAVPYCFCRCAVCCLSLYRFLCVVVVAQNQ